MQLGQGGAAVELSRSRVCVTSYFVPSGTTEARTQAVSDAAASNDQGRREGEGEESSPYPIPPLGKRKKCKAVGSHLSVK